MCAQFSGWINLTVASSHVPIYNSASNQYYGNIAVYQIFIKWRQSKNQNKQQFQNIECSLQEENAIHKNENFWYRSI